jgi:nicotinate-nucleotide adenylyltransferase
MKIGIFSGSFNPIHIGHLILANYITEFSEIEEVWFLVTPQNPWKENSALADENIRLEMVKMAIAGYPKLKTSDIEFSLPRPSYTINTLNVLEDRYPEHEFALIVGADNWENFDRWKDYETILSRYNIYVYPRFGYSVSMPQKLKKTVTVLNSPIVEISSTFIRKGLSEGKNMRAFLPEPVYNYVSENKVYR